MTVRAVVIADGRRGNRWSVYFPTVDMAAAFPMRNFKIVADKSAIMAQLRDPDIRHSGTDTDLLRAIVVQWIEKVNSWKRDNCIGSDVEGYDKTIRTIERRVDNENVSEVFAEFRKRGKDQVRFDMRINDEVVEKEPFERYFAWIMAEAATIVSENLVSHGHKHIILSDFVLKLLDELRAFRDEAAEKKRIEKRNVERMKCPNRRNGCAGCKDACSPANFSCENYSDGFCVELEFKKNAY